MWLGFDRQLDGNYTLITTQVKKVNNNIRKLKVFVIHFLYIAYTYIYEDYYNINDIYWQSKEITYNSRYRKM